MILFKTYARFLFDENDDGTGSGGAGGGKDGGAGDSDKSKNDKTRTIRPEDHERAVNDLKKFKGTAKELETKLQEREAELERLKNADLEKQNDYKKLYEQATAKNQDWEKKYNRLKETVNYNEKYKAAQSALVQAGLRKDALSILEKEDLSEIVTEHTSEGRILVNGVEEYVDSFKKKFAFAFEAAKPPKVNGGGGNGGSGNEGGTVTADDLYKLERKHGLKSPEYQAAFKTFKEQRLKRKN